jgi:hypothetical protein
MINFGNSRKHEIIVEFIVFLFVLLFLYAAGSKLTEYNNFVGQMGKSPMLTDFAPVLAWAVPAGEIVISIMLIVPKTKLIGMYAAFGLMVSFTFYIIAILTLSRELPCSCGGILSSLGWTEHLIFNIAFVLFSLIAIAIMTSKQQQRVTTI